MRDVVVVTGATGALGQAVVARLAAQGRYVVAVQRSASAAAGSGAALVVAEGDLAEEDNAARAFGRIAESVGRIAGLVNVAGGFAFEKVEDGRLSTWERLFHVNVKTAFNSCRAALPLLGQGGAIVNVGAAAALRAGVGVAAYAASKSAVARLTESLAEELKPRIRVNAVLPSIIDTPANRRDMPDADFGSWVSAAELAEVIAFLLSDQASGITGALLPVTGRV